jgi:NAD(P)-dependent dehydrogenase (short-subunit alcohol dehydrogenase family)
VDINGASAIVTGGASGIGAASPRQLAARGARVVVADLQADRGAELAEDIGGVFVSVDVTNTEQIEAAVKGS